jgi:DNA gyrase subunit B
LSTAELTESTTGLANGGEYTAEQIKHLKNAEHIRHRPGMYIGDTGEHGLHHLVSELIHNSIDEALAGYCKNIHVVMHVDGSLSVTDDGRGIPVEMHPTEGRPTLEVVMTVSGSSGKFDNNVYKVSAGLNGMGLKAVTALAEWSEAQIRRGGRVYVQKYERGKPVTEVQEIGAAPANQTGTKVTFKPDPLIFGEAQFSFTKLAERVRELAYINRGIAIHLLEEATGREEKFLFAGGIAEFVQYLNRDETVVHQPPISFAKRVDDVYVEVAFQYNHGDTELVRCYANNAYNPLGGTHLSGFRAGLTRTLNAYGLKEKIFKDDLKPESSDYREGLTAIVSVQLPAPKFESQMKVRLTSPEVEGIVTSVVNELLGNYLQENPKDAERILKKAMLAAEARKAAQKARDAAIKRKNLLGSGGLPGKLMDCTTKERDKSELFLVEGDSAGGSAEGGRRRQFQAVLPLRGKPLNTERARLEMMLKNDEIISIISALGIDIGNTEDLSKLRYGKIIILTDADVDGQHIRTLLLTFFFRQMRKLIENGHIYVARPPLYKIKRKGSKTTEFVQTAEDMERELISRGLTDTTLTLLPQPGRPGRVLQGEELATLVRPAKGQPALLGQVESQLQILERRGLSLGTLLPKLTEQGLPVYWVRLGRQEQFFHTAQEVDAFRVQEEARLGRSLVVADAVSETANPAKNAGTGSDQFERKELNEVRTLNRLLPRLAEFGLSMHDFVPLPRVAGREPPERFILANGDTRRSLPHLRDLLAEIRHLGERGLTVTRFKGLGEMDAEELAMTTLDPDKRTLLKITLEDAAAAEAWFKTLMGQEVEGRREFIMTHGVNVKDIDYHGA